MKSDYPQRLRPVPFGLVVALSAFFLVAGMSGVVAQGESLRSQISREGQVTVKVTPLTLSAGADAWRFEIEFDTHSVPLTHDLSAIAVLTDAGGIEYPPDAWEGDPPGGHHRKGVLAFKPIRPMPESVTLKIRKVGSAAERTFTWRLSKS